MKMFTLIKRETPWTGQEQSSIAELTNTHAFASREEPEMLVIFGKHEKEPIAEHIGTESFTHHVLTENDPMPDFLLKDIHMEIIKVASTGKENNFDHEV